MVRCDDRSIGIPVSVVTDCDVRPYDVDSETKVKTYNEKVTESEKAEAEKNQKYTIGSVHGFTSPRWTLEYCLALSCLSEDFHKSVHYGQKILYAKESISLNDEKIAEANLKVTQEAMQWAGLSRGEMAYKIYDLMLSKEGKSGLKAIVAQCLASVLRWKTSIIPDGFPQEKMFDLNLYGLKTDEQKKKALKEELEADQFLSYIVKAIKYAAGEAV